MNEPTHSTYMMATACIWYDDAVNDGRLPGPSPVNRQQCLDVLAVGQELESLRVEDEDDELPDGQLAAEMLIGLLMEEFDLDWDEAVDKAKDILPQRA